jgi:hypothetical protein
MSAYSTADQIELGQMDNAQKSVSTLSAAAATAATILGHVPSLDELKKPYLLPKESPFHVPPHVTLARMDDQLRDLQLQVKEVRFVIVIVIAIVWGLSSTIHMWSLLCVFSWSHCVVPSSLYQFDFVYM